jgi:predicted neuraminidase
MHRFPRHALVALFAVVLIAPAARSADPSPKLVRTWQGIPGLERTPKGRLFVCWFSGGPKEPSPENTVLLARSDDQGHTFTAPVAMARPIGVNRAFDPALWIDPQGKLWYLFNRGNKDTAQHAVYARVCAAPDASEPTWSDEFYVGYKETPFAFRINKPTVLSTGEWVMPVTHAAEPIYDWHGGGKHLHGVGISTDQGRSWQLHGALTAPSWALENMIVQLRDGRLWMLIRTGAGVLWQSHSADRGRTWSPATATTIPNPGSRFFIRRLRSGNLLLVNHYKFKGRSHLTARLSTDDGQTWNEGLLLDERANVSYPDGAQAADGLIWIVYDRDRQGAGEILLTTFREDDVVAGKNISGQVRLKQVVSRLDKWTPTTASTPRLLSPDWNPQQAADRVLARLVNVSAPQVKGAHDSQFVIVDGRAYVVSIANDVRPGENPEWDFCYAALSIVDLKSLRVEKRIVMAKSGQAYANETLPAGACFVPRILRRDAHTLRCYFSSEAPKARQSQVWFIDFDLRRAAFENRIQRVKLKTAEGTFDLQPAAFYADAAAHGLRRPAKDYGVYVFDPFKPFGGKTYAVLNNYPIGQNALAILNAGMDTFELLGHYNEPEALKLTESAVNRLPDGRWLAICRQDGGNRNYAFTESPDGRTWTTAQFQPIVPNGTNSKPTFDRFHDVYYLGWQEATRVNNVSRSVFNVDVSADGVHWERKYRFATDHSFQYPTFVEYQGTVYVSVTQGDSAPDRKERIMFGKLE